MCVYAPAYICICCVGVWRAPRFQRATGRWGQKIEHGSHPGCKPLMQVCQWRQPWPFFFIILQQRFSAAHHRITEMTTDEPHAPLSDSCSRRTQPGKNRGLHPRCYAAIETQHTVNDGHTSSFPGSTGLPIPVHPSSPPLRPFPPFCTVMPKAWVSLTFVRVRVRG